MEQSKFQLQFSPRDFEAVEFNQIVNHRIKIYPMYFKLGFSPESRIFGRFAVLDRIIKALDFLPAEYGFLIWDVYRPRAVQQKIFTWMSEQIAKKYPNLTSEQNLLETQKYAAPASKVGEEYCPSHLSGGAIDLTLYNFNTQQMLDMGTVFDDCSERAHSNYFAKKINLTSAEIIIQKHRDLLSSAMENVGFVKYQYEWWHFDIGDLLWSQATKQAPVFEPLFGDLEWPE